MYDLAGAIWRGLDGLFVSFNFLPPLSFPFWNTVRMGLMGVARGRYFLFFSFPFLSRLSISFFFSFFHTHPSLPFCYFSSAGMARLKYLEDPSARAREKMATILGLSTAFLFLLPPCMEGTGNRWGRSLGAKSPRIALFFFFFFKKDSFIHQLICEKIG